MTANKFLHETGYNKVCTCSLKNEGRLYCNADICKRKDGQIDRVKHVCAPIKMQCLGRVFSLRIERDCKDIVSGRIFIQVEYYAPCVKTGNEELWKSRKWYLSDHMTDDEIVKTCYAAFEACVKHEVMEGFTVAGRILFNPHIDYRKLLEISNHETQRDNERFAAR